MPTDKEIAEFAKRMRQKGERIAKALEQIQKGAKTERFTKELWNLAVDVAEGKIKSREAVERLNMKIPLRFTSFVAHGRIIHNRFPRSGIIRFYDEERTGASLVVGLSAERDMSHVHVFFGDVLKGQNHKYDEGLV